MSSNLKYIKLKNITTNSGVSVSEITLSYEVFGDESKLNNNGILVVHALTGNSHVGGEDGWWSNVVGDGKSINTLKHPIIAFNVPGNGFDGVLLDEYDKFNAGDIADLFALALRELQIERLFAVIGGSLGGGITWHLATQYPELFKKVVPFATHYQASDWVIGMSKIQRELLKIEKDPVQTARKMALLFYRTPESYQTKFERTKVEKGGAYNVDSYLDYQGEKLKDRFALEAYRAMNYIMATIDIAYRSTLAEAIANIQSEVHIVGVSTDLLFTAKEAKSAFENLKKAEKDVYYHEIDSIHGHDAFLIENNQLEKILEQVFKENQQEIKDEEKVKVLKFGGRSLANNSVNNVLNIIEKEAAKKKVFTVLSARGSATDELENLLESARKQEDCSVEFEAFKQEQTALLDGEKLLDTYFEEIQKILDGVKLVGDYSTPLKDRFLAYGEMMSAIVVKYLLEKRGITTAIHNVQAWLKTDNTFGNAQVLKSLSEDLFKKENLERENVQVELVSGFIASNLNGQTTTLGRNGSNYTAALLASFLNAEELQNWTHVDGIFTANPSLVSNAKQIELLSYNEANELANFGTEILHAKTIIPLIEKNIPLRILNTLEPDNKGTLITKEGNGSGVKSVTVLKEVALISLTGRGLLGTVGIDGRIFGTLMHNHISIRNISQASSERGLGFIVDIEDADKAVELLREEFDKEIYTKDINQIYARKDVSVVSVIGDYLDYFDRVFQALKANKVEPILFNNSINGNNISIVVADARTRKAVNVIHSHIFGTEKTLNVVVFGKGLVGGTLINQINNSRKILLDKRNTRINVFAVADSKRVLLNANGISENWKEELASTDEGYTVADVINFAEENNLENLVCVDTTASKDFVENYLIFVDKGFDLVSANKIANTLSYDFYTELRDRLKQNRGRYLYETNVGAGLPLVDTISQLHHSGDRIKKIRGVFSGSLSYIFNNYSVSDKKFSDILLEAKDKGYTEPDPREDLSGNDVGRKLLILAREIDLKNEFDEVKINNLIPKELQEVSSDEFFANLHLLDEKFSKIKAEKNEDEVLRYVGELNDKGELSVDLVKFSKSSSLGQIKGADSIFEIYTESYGDEPLVIQGAGAGAEVTARGVYGDLMKLV
jgi:homoserine O-acetyltransferase